MTGGIEYLFNKNKTEYIKGFGEIVDKNTIKVSNIGKEEMIESKNIIIATGSVPAPLKGFNVDEEKIVTSTGALKLKEVPKKMIIIGAGVIGLEMGSVYKRLGSEITVIEYAD